MKKIIFLLFISMFLPVTAQVIILDKDATDQSSAVNPNAVLELRSDNKGMIIPQISTEPTLTNADAGMIFYDTTKKCLKGWDGEKWQRLSFCINTPPVASNVNISGLPNPFQALTGEYDYSDADNDLESVSQTQYIWQRRTFSFFPFQTISSEVNKTYSISYHDKNSEFRFCVKPHDGNEFGEIYCSNPVKIIVANPPILPENSLMISEYIEGLSFEKYLEIYNPSNKEVDLSNYSIRTYIDGSTTQFREFKLSSLAPIKTTIPAGETIVLKHSLAKKFQGVSYSGGYAMSFNGNDTVVLYYDDGTTQGNIDVFGAFSGGNFALDTSFRRYAGNLANNEYDYSEWDKVLNSEEYMDLSELGLPPSNYMRVSFSEDKKTLIEGENVNYEIKFNVKNPGSQDIKVNMKPVTGTANLNEDYTTNLPIDFFIIPAGVSNKTFNVNIVNDDILEDLEENVVFEIESVNSSENPKIGRFSSLELTIIDDEKLSQPASDIMISEYVEGSLHNKYLEIYNGTTSVIDLSAYKFRVYVNGSTVYSDIPLNGTLNPGLTKVYANNGAGIYKGETSVVSFNFNGNDPIELLKNNTVIETIGIVGVDNEFGKDITLRRKLGYGPSATYSQQEWNKFGKDDVSDLGNHLGGELMPIVKFKKSTGYALENSGNYNLILEVLRPKPQSEISAKVELVSGNATALSSYTPQTITWAAGDINNKVVNLNVGNDTNTTNDNYVFKITILSGNANVGNSFLFTVLDSQAQPVVANGDFEYWSENTPLGWTKIDKGISISKEVNTYSNGNSSAKISVNTSSQSNTDFRQKVSLIKGVKYKISFDVFNLNNHLTIRPFVEGLLNQGYGSHSDNGIINNWQTVTNTFTANSSTEIEVGLRFYTQPQFNAKAEIIIDNFKITPL